MNELLEINNEKPSLIIVSGFGWSGSGALVDFLKENTRLEVAGNDEIIFFWCLYKILKKVRHGKSINPNKCEYVQLFLSKIPNSYSFEKKRFYENIFKNYFKNLNVSRNNYTQFSLEIINDLEKLTKRIRIYKLSEEKINEEIGRIITDYFLFFANASLNNKEKILFFDNFFHPQQLDEVLNIDFSKFNFFKVFCVDRDPRDQFYDHYQRYELGLGLWHHMNIRQKMLDNLRKLKFFQSIFHLKVVKMFAASIFCYMYKIKRQKFSNSINFCNEKKIKISIEKIFFEDFVKNNNNLREKIKNEVDSFVKSIKHYSNWKEFEYFVPNISLKNINKYENSCDKKVFEIIEKNTRINDKY